MSEQLKPCLDCMGIGHTVMATSKRTMTVPCHCTWKPCADPPLGNQWEDEDTPETPAIEAAHPLNTGDYGTYAEAMRLVGSRHSKYALVDLVNWLLVERAAAQAYASLRESQSDDDDEDCRSACAERDNLIDTLLAALKGVLKEADRKTVAFDAAHEAIDAAEKSELLAKRHFQPSPDRPEHR